MYKVSHFDVFAVLCKSSLIYWDKKCGFYNTVVVFKANNLAESEFQYRY